MSNVLPGAPFHLHKCPCSQSREVAPRGTWPLPPPTRWSSLESHKAEGEECAGLVQASGPPPHAAAEAPAGHGLDPALWTSLTLASDLNIWQQADKGCSGNSLCCCQQARPLHCPERGTGSPHPPPTPVPGALPLCSHSLPLPSQVSVLLNFSLMPLPPICGSVLLLMGLPFLFSHFLP